MSHRDPVCFLIYIDRVHHIPILKPLWEEGLKAGIHSFYVLWSNDPARITPAEAKDLRKYFKSQGLFPYTLSEKIKFPAVFVADHAYHPVEGLGPIVHVCHGTISKGIYFMPFPTTMRENRADLLCVPGTVHQDRLSPYFKKKCVVTGMPKLDRMFQQYIKDRAQIRKRLKVGDSMVLVLIAPTFNKELSLTQQLDNVLQEFPGENTQFLLKLHGEMKTHTLGDLTVETVLIKNRVVHTIHTLDITPLYSASDMLISDCSSVLFEYSVTGKPVVSIQNKHFKRYPLHHANSLEYVYGAFQKAVSPLAVPKKPVFKSTGFIGEIKGKSARHVLKIATQLTHADYAIVARKRSKKGYEKIPWHISVHTHRTMQSDIFNHGMNVRELTSALEHIKEEYIVFKQADETVSAFFSDTLVTHLRSDETLDYVLPFRLPFIISEIKSAELSFRLWYEFSGAHISVRECLINSAFAIRKEALKKDMHTWKGVQAMDAFVMKGERIKKEFSSWHCYFLYALDAKKRKDFIEVLKPVWQAYQPFLKSHKESLYFFEMGRALKEMGRVSEGFEVVKHHWEHLKKNTQEPFKKRIEFHFKDWQKKMKEGFVKAD